ncbi:MAG: hypothetical protein WCT19_03595 [Candidatus Paceibacterota bacterium]|jgi:hypothetical protein
MEKTFEEVFLQTTAILQEKTLKELRGYELDELTLRLRELRRLALEKD